MTNPLLLADAIEALEAGKVPEGEALRLVVELLGAEAGVRTELRRRKALRRWDELWATGDYLSLGEVDRQVAMRLGVRPVTVRGWRFERRLAEPVFRQQKAA